MRRVTKPSGPAWCGYRAVNTEVRGSTPRGGARRSVRTGSRRKVCSSARAHSIHWHHPVASEDIPHPVERGIHLGTHPPRYPRTCRVGVARSIIQPCHGCDASSNPALGVGGAGAPTHGFIGPVPNRVVRSCRTKRLDKGRVRRQLRGWQAPKSKNRYHLRERAASGVCCRLVPCSCSVWFAVRASCHSIDSPSPPGLIDSGRLLAPRACSSNGRAPTLHVGGSRFESGRVQFGALRCGDGSPPIKATVGRHRLDNTKKLRTMKEPRNYRCQRRLSTNTLYPQLPQDILSMGTHSIRFRGRNKDTLSSCESLEWRLGRDVYVDDDAICQ